MTLAKALAQNATLQELLDMNKNINSNLAAIAIAQGKQASLDYEEILKVVAAGAGATMFPIGSIFTTVKDIYSYPWAVMHHGTDTDGEPYMRLRVIKAIDNLQFDNQEAFYYCENGLAAGQYYITVKSSWGGGCVVNSTWNFTLTQAVPAGGQLVGFYAMPDRAADYTGYTVASYTSNSSLTPIETVAATAGTAGSSLCIFAFAGDTTDLNVNSLYRLAYGNGNIGQSAILQRLNSSGAAGTFWTPQHKFDRPPSWNSTEAGFMSKLPDGFLDIVHSQTKTIDTNNVFETGDYTTNSSYTITGKFLLPTRFEVFGTVERGNYNETQWDFYKNANDKERIMYDNNANARDQCLASPSVGTAGLVRLVGAPGVLGGGLAGYGYAVAPACIIRSRTHV